MIGQLDKRFLLPGDAGWPRRSPTTKCPNPACGVDLIVTAESVGKKRACPSCGANLVCSKGNGVHAAKAAPAAVQPYDLSAEATATKHVRHEATSERGHTLPIVRTGCIGRGNAGKTALIRALSDGPNMIPLSQIPALLAGLLKIHSAAKRSASSD